MGAARKILPGFGLTFGITIIFLICIVLLPMAALSVSALELSWDDFWAKAASPAALASYELTFFSSLAAALFNGFFGLICAWTLVRSKLPGKRIIDGFIDLPFAVPGSVGGIAIAALVSKNGLLGQFLVPMGIELAYTRAAVTFALIFAGLPYVIRALQPVIENLEPEAEEAATMLGSSRLKTFFRVTLPTIYPALLSGMLLAFIRGLGEFGTVIFVSGNIPFESEVTTQVIFAKIQAYDRAGAAAISLVVLGTTFLLLLAVSFFEPIRKYITRKTLGEAPLSALVRSKRGRT